MRWLNCATIRLMSVGFLASLVVAGGNANADFTFSTPVELGPPILFPGDDPQGCCFSRDGLELYFSSTRPDGYGLFDIWVATRETVDAPWGEPENLGPNVNGSAGETDPSISPDGLELYFTLYQDFNIRVCSRPSKDAPWSNPEVLGPPVGAYGAYCPEVSADGLSLYFGSGSPTHPGGYGSRDILVSNRATTSDPWSEPVNLGPVVNTDYFDSYPSISSDALCLFFASNRPGGYGGTDIWVTTRPTTDAEWGPLVNYPNLNQARDDWSPAISPDGSVLYFESIFNFWQCSIIPIVDLNGDGIVDAADMCIMVDHWGEGYPLCDIGPMPWGDGIVDVEDLKVLAEHLFEDVNDPTLIAHWPLDEAQGVIAYDDAADCHGTLMGGPVWQPDGGMLAGALQSDGIDDYVRTDFVLNPAEGKFSVLAWIKGGAPGQVIVSQESGAHWLMTDLVDGELKTDLKEQGTTTGRNPIPPGPPLTSSIVVTDGDWHRIGFVWDGSYRHLYVDSVEVAMDVEPLSGLESAEGGLHFATGSDLAPGTFFSGLIDDIRIYNRVVSP